MNQATTAGLFHIEKSPGLPGSSPAREISEELVQLAFGIPDRAERSRQLFRKLRRSLGSPRFNELVLGIASLSRENHPAGARLLASFLDTTTIEARLVPPLVPMSSSRRIHLYLERDDKVANAFSRNWLGRLTDLTRRIEDLHSDQGAEPELRSDRPGQEHPWPLLRKALVVGISEIRDEDSPSPSTIRLIQDLLRMEVDALEERASRLAGIIDPFRVVAIQRLLPILGSLDPRIRDTRLFITRLNEGDLDSLFRQQWSRASEVMEQPEYGQLMQALENPELDLPMANLLRNRVEHPRTIRMLASGIHRLLRLGECLSAVGVSSACDDLLGTAELVGLCDTGRGIEIPLTPGELELIAPILAVPKSFEGALPVPAIEGSMLVLPWPDLETDSPTWSHEFPAAERGDVPALKEAGSLKEAKEDGDTAVSGGGKDDFGSTEIKKLVMNSLQTTSVLLSYLRNSKVTSIPGLVTEVAVRTRNPQIISTIAGDRALYSGFANRDVPLACLRNPSNVSVKVLRKFVHVKFVSKMDLKLMSQDKAGVRRELRQEIDHYLESLS